MYAWYFNNAFVLIVLGPPQSIYFNPSSHSLHVSWTEPLCGASAETVSHYVVVYSADGFEENSIDVFDTNTYIVALTSNTLFYVSVVAKGFDDRLGTPLEVSSTTCKYNAVLVVAAATRDRILWLFNNRKNAPAYSTLRLPYFSSYQEAIV